MSRTGGASQTKSGLDPQRGYKVVPASVWAQVRRDYCAGMTARACAIKYGVGESGLRSRANKERWVKDASPPPAEPVALRPVRSGPTPISPSGIGRGALATAVEALLDGRPADAKAIVEALDDVLQVAETFADDDKAAGELAHMYETDPGMFAALGRWAEQLAETLMGEHEPAEAYAAWAFAWRARKLGNEAAATDRALAERQGWTERLYDEAGRLRPASG